MSEARLTRESSDLPSDFLLKLALVGSALVTAPWAKNDVAEESKAAKMWIVFLGFMNQEQRNALRMTSMRGRAKEFEPDANGSNARIRNALLTFVVNPC